MRNARFPHPWIVLIILWALLAGSAAAQAPTLRVVLLPFDASGSVDALALGLPAAVQRALQEVDGIHVPPIGDAAVVFARARDALEDPIAAVRRVFVADALVVARVTGGTSYAIEGVIDLGARGEVPLGVAGRVSDPSAAARAVTEAILAALGVTPNPADLAALRRAWSDAPSLPSLGAVAVAAARLPNVRLDALAAAAALDPTSAWVRSEYARALALSGNLSAAATEAEAAVAASEGIEALVALGVVQLAGGDPAAAATFAQAVERNPAHAVALVGLAQSGAAGDRVALLERAIVAAPRLADAHVALAEAQTSAARAVAVLRRATASLPDSVAVQGALLDLVVATGDALGALELLREALADPIGRRGATYALAERLPDPVARDALALLAEGAALFPESSDVRRAEIALLRRVGDDAAADAAQVAWLESGFASAADVIAWADVLATRGRADEGQAWLDRLAGGGDAELRTARLDLAAGRARAALAVLEPRLAAGNADAVTRTLTGIALGRVGRLAEGIAVLEGVLASPEADADAETRDVAARGLAVIREQQRLLAGGGLTLSAAAAEAFEQGLYALETGDAAAAQGAFARARALQDVGVLAFYEGYARQIGGDPRGAIAAYEAARVDLGTSDVLLNNLGYAQLQVGRLDLALATLRTAVALAPGNALAHLNLGLVHYGLTRFPEAVASFETALGIDPSLRESVADVLADARRRSQP
jgi:tetratricopeptide (TPR) repeat protein